MVSGQPLNTTMASVLLYSIESRLRHWPPLYQPQNVLIRRSIAARPIFISPHAKTLFWKTWIGSRYYLFCNKRRASSAVNQFYFLDAALNASLVVMATCLAASAKSFPELAYRIALEELMIIPVPGLLGMPPAFTVASISPP